MGVGGLPCRMPRDLRSWHANERVRGARDICMHASPHEHGERESERRKES